MVINEENYMTINFSNTYFSHDDCSKIGYIREDIETKYANKEINERERALLITSLLYAMDKIAKTCGHYDAYRQGVEFDMHLELLLPEASITNNKKNKCYNIDSNDLAGKIVADLVYIDPPYYSPLSDNEYVRRYHFVEGLARDWKGVEIQENTVTKKFKSYPTPFSTRKGAADAFDKLFKKFSDSILIVSYSSNSQPTQDEMVALMSKYKEHVEVVPIDYTYSFGNQKHAKTNRNKVQEYLFVGFNGEDVWQKQKLQLKK